MGYPRSEATAATHILRELELELLVCIILQIIPWQVLRCHVMQHAMKYLH